MNRNALQMKPQPVVQESSHPYVDDVSLTGHVKIPGAEGLHIEFDRQCSTELRHDPLTIMDGTGKTVAVKSGREWSDWSSELLIKGISGDFFRSDRKRNVKFFFLLIQGTKSTGSSRRTAPSTAGDGGSPSTPSWRRGCPTRWAPIGPSCLSHPSSWLCACSIRDCRSAPTRI